MVELHLLFAKPYAIVFEKKQCDWDQKIRIWYDLANTWWIEQ